MEGKEVFRHAVTKLASVVDEALVANNFTSADLDWMVPHQANRRILAMTAKKTGLSEDKRGGDPRQARQHLRRVDSACAPHRGARRPDQASHLVLIEAMGGGFAWGSALVRM